MTSKRKAEAIESLTDKQIDMRIKRLQKEMQHRNQRKANEYAARREGELGEPSIETYMALRYPDQNFDFAKKYKDWFNDTYVYDKTGYRNLGLGPYNGFLRDTGQNGLTVSMDRDTPLSQQLSVEKFMPHVAEITLKVPGGERRGKYLGVDEHTNSADGMYMVGVFGHEAALYVTVYGTTNVVFPSNLRKVLRYIHKHHWCR